MTNDQAESVSGITVVVPVYNSAATLSELVVRLERILLPTTRPFEVVLVNDGSRDRSWEVIRQLAQSHDCVIGVNLARNYGQHNALLCGIRMAQNEAIVTMDDDLQHPPEEIPTLLAKLEEGYDVVYGTPHEQQHGIWRNLSSRITKLALRSAMGAETADKASAFRAFRTRLRDAFADYRSPSVSIDVLLSWATTRFWAVSVRHDPRRAGVSNYNFRKLVTHAFDMMTGFTTWPLQMATVIGLTFAAFGLVVLAYVMANYLIHWGSVPGFTFLASLIAIFSGAQLFTVGIIGEYLARMYKRTMDRPVYVVKSTVTARRVPPASCDEKDITS
jgi:glycosyltransferase involved in cell wall biosynthesis